MMKENLFMQVLLELMIMLLLYQIKVFTSFDGNRLLNPNKDGKREVGVSMEN